MATAKTPIIEVNDVRRSFRSIKKKEGFKGALDVLFNPEYQVHEALKGVSFSIDEGALVGLIGANGAGKTTLLKILSGLIPPTSGEAQVMGYKPFDRSLDFRQRISLVMGQKAQLWWDLPGIDAFELLRAIYEIPKDVYKKHVQELSEMLDVGKHLNTQIRRLSLGERMKMELIGALLHWPEVIFLDEPTIGLDVMAASSLRKFLKNYNLALHKGKNGRESRSTMIITSHNMDDIESLCSRILILKDGELIFDGSPKKLHKTEEKQLRVRLTKVPSIEDLSQVTGLPQDKILLTEENQESENIDMLRFKVSPKQMPAVLQAVMNRYEVIEMGVEEQSLEDAIKTIFEGSV